MRRMALLSLVLVLAAPATPADAHPPASVSGFRFPESVWWDGDTGSFYVTNFGGRTLDPNGREADGYVSHLSGEGRVWEARWVTGLRSPKGMRRVGDALYVADVGQVVVIDVAAGAIRSTIDLDAIGAQFPNDVALDEATGDVYVSDMLRNAVYRLPRGSETPEVWLESPDLDYPNGLLVNGGQLLVASWGQPSDPGGSRPEELGRVLTVDLATKAVTPLGGMARLGRMDGIEEIDGAYLVTDNPGGRLVRVRVDGSVEEITTGIGGAADLALRRGDRIAGVPLLTENQVRFIDVP